VSKNKAVMEAALKFAQSRLSPPTLGLLASEAAMDAPDSYLLEVIKTYKNRRDTLIEALNSVSGIEVSVPAGAFYCLVKLPVEDSDDFAQWLLESFEYDGKTLMVAPASGFYGNRALGKSLIRIAYVLEASKLKESAKLLSMALAAYPKSLQTTHVR
jgi:aspartate aminotransferase